jgi:hypothetical protein
MKKYESNRIVCHLVANSRSAECFVVLERGVKKLSAPFLFLDNFKAMRLVGC